MYIDLKSLLTAFFSALGSMEGAIVAEPPAPNVREAAQVSCDFRLEPVRDRTVLVAEILTQDDPWAGEFHVKVTGNGANTLNLMQSGAVNLKPHQAVRIAQFGLGGTAQENFDATCDLSE